MKKRLLYIAPDYYGFNEVVFEGLKKYSDCDITHIISNEKYKYKNIWYRIYNFLSKTFLRKNIKEKLREGAIKNTINRNPYYDYLLINAPYLLKEDLLDFILEKSKISICVFWDSIDKIPMQKDYLNKINVIYSFEPEDCKKYNLKEITNFFFAKDENRAINYDVAYLATYDDRMDIATTIFKYFQQHNILAKGKIFMYKPHIEIKKLPPNIEIINEIVPFSESYKYYLDSKIILDIAHSNQEGLSFRPYEAMGLRKKLITTNKSIVNYDFYNPNNIFLIEDVNNIVIPEGFFKSDYEDIDPSVRDKYYIKNWINKIINV
nr:lipopolysaccharide core biosynthesis protein rfaS [uncultured Capnocytophaga sp.]